MCNFYWAVQLLNIISIKKLFYIGFILYAIVNIVKAQPCNGSWALQRPLASQCVVGQWVGWQNGGNPVGCPINPIYVGVQTNTFTFTQPASMFSIDFRAFDGAILCARMEIKINGIFYPLSASNISEIPPPPGSTCTSGSLTYMQLTPDGYLTVSTSGGSGLIAMGRITISSVNALSLSVSTNDTQGTIFSNPFNCTTVPLKLESFTGNSSSECNVLLNWKTGTEFNIKNIEVERSENGSIFNKVGEVSPKGSDSRYSFFTSNISDAFFRLKINDLDGYYEYSNILSIKSNCSNIVYQVVPNPTSGSIEIMGLKNDDKIIVLDILGRIVLTFNSLQNNNKFDVQKLVPGMYILKIVNDGMIKSNIKFVKN